MFVNVFYHPIAQVVQMTTHAPDKIIFYIFVSALFLPEVAIIISSKFRGWLKNAVENNDGVLDGSELKETIAYFGAYYCAKLFALGMLCDIFYVVDIQDTYIYMAFAGFTGTTSMIQLGKIFKK